MNAKAEDGHGHGRARRSRQEAREEILVAAERFLWERPVRDLSVGELMENTTIGRSAFYVYFQDRYDLVAALLERLEAQLLESAQPWLAGPGDSDPLADIRLALAGTVAVWARHGPVLRAIADAASQDRRVESAYRWGHVEHFIVAVAARIEAGQSAGRVTSTVDATEVAAALVLMNERYLADGMGRLPQSPTVQVVETLYAIWSAVLYGPGAGEPVRRAGPGPAARPRR